jgi:small subunit ribosomal protein S18
MEPTTDKPQSTPAEKLSFFDVEVLTRHVTDTGKILPRRITHLSAKQQRHVSQSIKRARHMLLMK